MTLKDNYKQPILANKGVEKIQTEKKPKQSIDQKKLETSKRLMKRKKIKKLRQRRPQKLKKKTQVK